MHDEFKKKRDTRSWWKEAVVYQIYPRSFKDANGDGIGDLRGIIGQLDYIQHLGVDAVWLNPVFVSPNVDGGYDIEDYYAIQPEFGAMADFDALLNGLHERGLRLILDIVVNHTSDKHPWFEASRQSTGNPYRDFYFWRPGAGKGPPNNWPSFFGGSAWQYDEKTGEYYLHLFSSKQPDLNWENPALREEVLNIMRFWLNKGVDGFRLDVISAISKHTGFPDTDTGDFNETVRKYYTNGPRVTEFIRLLREQVWNDYDMVAIGEGPGITPDTACLYVAEPYGLDIIFHFGHMFLDQGPGGRFDPVPWTLEAFKAVFNNWDNVFAATGWGSVFLGNHDFARMVSRWGNDREYLEQSATGLATLLLSMRGTPFIFQGDEIGMTNITLNELSEFKDIDTQNGWREAQQRGLTAVAFMEIANYAGRDNARTPMQWDASAGAGFSESTPWMPVNVNKNRINVAEQVRRPHSVLNYYIKMIALRKANPVLIYGRYEQIDSAPAPIFAYYRILKAEKWLILLNFSDVASTFDRDGLGTGELKISNYPDPPRSGLLRPWEAVVFSQ